MGVVIAVVVGGIVLISVLTMFNYVIGGIMEFLFAPVKKMVDGVIAVISIGVLFTSFYFIGRTILLNIRF